MSTADGLHPKKQRLDSYCLTMEDWPVVTDDNFEDALPNYELSKKSLHSLIEPLEENKVVCLAGFLGVTARWA